MWQRNFSKPAKGENTKVESSENSTQRKNCKHIRRPGISSRVGLKIKPKLNCSKPSLENNKTQTTQTQSKTRSRWSVESHSFFAPSSVAWATGAASSCSSSKSCPCASAGPLCSNLCARALSALVSRTQCSKAGAKPSPPRRSQERYPEKRILKWKCTKHVSSGQFFEVLVSKN